jgi:hypothetical protein
MLLDILDDVFLLDLPLEPAEGAFDRLTLLNFDFSHATYTPFGWREIDDEMSETLNMLGYHR